MAVINDTMQIISGGMDISKLAHHPILQEEPMRKLKDRDERGFEKRKKNGR